jgi:hypothetical protein
MTMTKEATYSVRVVRRENGHTETFQFQGYAALQELLDDITKAAEERGWLELEDESTNQEKEQP